MVTNVTIVILATKVITLLFYCVYANTPELFTMRIFSILFIYTLTHFLLSVFLTLNPLTWKIW